MNFRFTGRFADSMLEGSLRIRRSHTGIIGDYTVNTMTPTPIVADQAFFRRLRTLFARSRAHKIVETGTYQGLGTTLAICDALAANEFSADQFYSIEVNPNFYAQAWANLSNRPVHPRLLRGLSIPRNLLPSEQAETHFPEALDDLLGYVIRTFDRAPDFVLLDSASSLGLIELQYALSLIKAPCHIGLNNLQGTHGPGLQFMQSDARFKLVEVNRDKTGYCIAHFTP